MSPSTLFFNRLYYGIKRFLPWHVRLILKQAHTRKILKNSGDFWPIQESVGRTPPDWPGWPDGKQFALVLTHDVEGPRGLSLVKQLAELEMKLNFRSSFNLIPEGEYLVPSALRTWLTDRDFEVGVHDLHHDGQLYSSRKGFQRKAIRISGCLKAWKAVGFRSGFMFRNLDWIRDLNAGYDASTFDVDPFEPQPDGVGTIFPFWINGSGNRRGYMELPYTMAQDSTLFLVLEEKSIEIWKRKVDWLAEHGGMALVNVHPDYIDFNGSTGSRSEFPSVFYSDLLEYVSAKYGDRVWRALPCEVAAYCARFKPRHPLQVGPDYLGPDGKQPDFAPKKMDNLTNQADPVSSASRARPGGRNIAMVSHSFYENDNRVRRYAETLVERGDRVEVYSLAANRESVNTTVVNGVVVHRVQLRKRDERGPLHYALRLLRFLVVCSLILAWRFPRARYDLVHVHNVPDFLVFAAWLPKLAGAKVILDIHDIVPEFFMNKFGKTEDAFLVRLLRAIEKISAAFADHVIVSNHLWHEKMLSRSVSVDRSSVFLNHVDEGVFFPRPGHSKNGVRVIVFPGGLQWHQGVDIAVEAFSELVQKLPDVQFHIYGDGDQRAQLEKQCSDLGLQGKVIFWDPISITEVPDILAGADLGVVPKRADSFGNEAYSTKIMEFMSMGLPVVASRTRVDMYYFNDSLVRFFPSSDAGEMAVAMKEVLEDDVIRQSLVENGLRYVEQNCWGNRKKDYLRLVDDLICGRDLACKTEATLQKSS